MDDEQLARKACRGDRDALAELVVRHRRWIYTVAYRIALREPDALDITQNVLLKLVSAVRSFQVPGNFRAWLTVLTTNAAIDYLRQAVRRESPVERDQLEALANSWHDPPPNPREALEAKTQWRRVENALRELTLQQRAVLALWLEEDLPPREIAARLGLSPEQVRVQLFRAIAKLKTILGDVETQPAPRED
ncbi:MAG: RNA polymerase sigma factor [bacterium]